MKSLATAGPTKLRYTIPWFIGPGRFFDDAKDEQGTNSRKLNSIFYNSQTTFGIDSLDTMLQDKI